MLDAVDELIKPHREVVKQRVPGNRSPLCGYGCPKAPHTHDGLIVHDPLLTQMEAAIRGEFATDRGTAASLAFTRGMVDSTALHHMLRITAAIRDWSRIVNAPRRPDAGTQLAAWYVAFMQTEPVEGRERFYIGQLRKWASLIRDHLEVVDVPVPHPCPAPGCVQRFDPHSGRAVWWDARVSEWSTNPVVFTYRPSDDAEAFVKASARCRACGCVWSARELAHDLEMVKGGHEMKAPNQGEQEQE